MQRQDLGEYQGTPGSRSFIPKDLREEGRTSRDRKEWKRLRDVEAAEKVKPVNQVCTIQLHYKRCEVTHDGVVIDKSSPVLI